MRSRRGFKPRPLHQGFSVKHAPYCHGAVPQRRATKNRRFFDTLFSCGSFLRKKRAYHGTRAMFSVMCGALRQPMTARKDGRICGVVVWCKPLPDGSAPYGEEEPVRFRHAAPMLRGHRAKAWSRGGMKRGSIPQACGFDSQTRKETLPFGKVCPGGTGFDASEGRGKSTVVQIAARHWTDGWVLGSPERSPTSCMASLRL